MRVLFYFYSSDWGRKAITGLFQSLRDKGWQQGILMNTSHYFFRQGISDYIILSPENESNNFLNLLNRLKQDLRLQNQQTYIWLIVHHANAEIQYNRNYIGEAERNAIDYTCHIPVRGINFCNNAIRNCSRDFTTLLSACGYSQDQPHLALRDPLIIIFTEEEYKEWEKAGECRRKANAYDDNINPLQGNKINSPRIIEFKTDNYTILFVKENGLEIKDNEVGADELLNKILNKWEQQFDKEDIYVAVHALNDYIKEKKQFEDKAHYICYFHHIDTEPHKSFCKLLVDVITNIELENKEEAEENCEEIIEKIKKLSQYDVKTLSILKHRLFTIFDPIRIDLDTLITQDCNHVLINNFVKRYKNVISSELYPAIQGLIKEYEAVENKLIKETINKIESEINQVFLEDLIKQKLKELIKAIDDGDENKMIHILRLYGNVYEKWLNELTKFLDKNIINLE